MFGFDHKKIEDKWRKLWQDKGVYELDTNKKVDKKKHPKGKWYNLMMFPYPSAEGLHVGNMYAFTGADIYGRFKAMQGYQVFEPIGLDGFGIHSENYAIKIGKHPTEQAKVSQKRFYDQLSRIGNRFNWDYRLETYDPEYYKWTQWLFVKMFEKGLAYRKKSSVNWCPSCKTVLSDEQVEAGRCERCKTETTKKETWQWFFKITKYAQRLLDNLDKIDWPEKIKIAQRQWIGRKEGINIKYKVKILSSKPNLTVTCFTTRPDTLYGVSFIVVAPEYAKNLLRYVPEERKVKVEKYIKQALKKTEQLRKKGEKSKTGVDMGIKVVNPVNNKEISVWAADYVLMDYGSGAVMGVPAHDQRDWEFAKKKNLDIVEVILGGEVGKQAYDGEGELTGSGNWNGLKMPEELDKVIKDIERKKIGKRQVDFRLRDWCISRQRYWGPPIPMNFCQQCFNKGDSFVKGMAGWCAEKVENLPVELPDVTDFEPTGDGRSPMEKADKDWLFTKCPKCGGKARRETDVSDTFLDSSWYFLRYPSVNCKNEVFDKEIIRQWLPVDAYIGGAEHAVLHLMYSRFVWMALSDWGYLDKDLGDEPFPFLFGHGLIIKDGKKMSKSRGNVVNPDEYIDKYGADSLRMYLMFVGSYDQGGDFRDTGMVGMKKFLDRLWRLFEGKMGKKTSEKLLIKLEQTIKKVSEDMAEFHYNTAIAALMECVNVWREKGQKLSQEDAKRLVKIIAPMAPFMSEEWWEKLGGKESVHNQLWPSYDKKVVEGEKVTLVIQVNGKLRGQMEVLRQEANDREKILKLAKENDRVAEFLKGKKARKEIFVPSRLVNLVVDYA